MLEFSTVEKKFKKMVDNKKKLLVSMVQAEDNKLKGEKTRIETLKKIYTYRVI